jgi:hypothetical protein
MHVANIDDCASALLWSEAMSRENGIAAYRAFFGLLVLAAIGTQLADLSGRGVLDPLHYFSYFTIDSNLLAAALFLILAVRRGQRSAGFEMARGVGVICMTVTGIVFSVLLSGTDVDTAIPWVNDVVHSVMPIVVAVDWLLDPPRMQLTYRQGLRWVIYPAIWLAYTLVKGPIVDKYPYPFLDPANGGYGTVAIYVVGILAVMALVCLAAVWVANAAGRRGQEPTVS